MDTQVTPVVGLSEPTESPQNNSKGSDTPQLKSFLERLPGAPETSTVDQWKQEYGDVFLCGFSEEELFIWRALRRNELRDLQNRSQSEGLDPLAYEELVVQSCLLWPRDLDLNKKAGTASTLHEQIMQNSNFLPPQLAAGLVQKL